MNPHDHLIFDSSHSKTGDIIAQLRSVGVVLLRQVLPPDVLFAFQSRIQRVFAFRQQQLEQWALPEGYIKNYDYNTMTYLGLRELDLPGEPPYQILRWWKRSRLPILIHTYFTQPASWNLSESVVRRQLVARPDLYVPFHQDGPFLEQDLYPVLNCWMPLHPCGKTSPGLEVLPIGLHQMLPRQPQAFQSQYRYYEAYALPDEVVFQHASPEQLWHPEMLPGDVLLMDHWVIHRTYATSDMGHDRLSLEIRCLPATNIPATLAQQFWLLPFHQLP